MAENKTKENDNSVIDFLNTIEDDAKRSDCFKIVEIMSESTGFEAKMWGSAIIGFGSYHYRYESGRAGDAPLAGFSPRKKEIALYFSAQFKNREQLLAEFGKHKTGKACVYINKLSDVDADVFKKMIENSVNEIKSTYP
ncbi:DUF1801 domain-containing protein [Pedobacter endophyticus]|uniref:DUF1801 domain-containing protein n=1 Tax=Pedobacter endophyticus TaxID=2789740 RepID=A0A7S9L2P7_9SPHI|nr:DUF1801 domain-containing protein [Pedobacter endophyticus]QPH41384.1 DUF1801 domain-containing protein [Pedobacter endophyticus]